MEQETKNINIDVNKLDESPIKSITVIKSAPIVVLLGDDYFKQVSPQNTEGSTNETN
jgi:hypothetical protein